jgi:D-3-phosphoglycerate dehydrogenase
LRASERQKQLNAQAAACLPMQEPGFIGKFSSTLGEAGINIATFHVGRETPGGDAVALIEIDGRLPPAVLDKVRALPQVQQAKPLKF